MFGYVTVYKPELKIKEFEKYKAYYCGLCKKLREDFGFLEQMTLTYDMTFVILLLTSLYEPETKSLEKHCVIHPLKKHWILQNEVTSYAAAMNVVLAYYHMKDNWEDERSIQGFIGKTTLKNSVEKIVKVYPRVCEVIEEAIKELRTYEKENYTQIDIVAGCFGKLMAELLTYKKDEWEEHLRKLGFFLGKFIYIMDAYDDVEKDVKEGNYNPFKEVYKSDMFEEGCYQMLQMMMAEASREFEILPCVEDVAILRNIIYTGVWLKFEQKRSKEK